jgi:hypothetical protein
MAFTINYSISNIILTRPIYAEPVSVHDTYNIVTPAHDICVMNAYEPIIYTLIQNNKKTDLIQPGGRLRSVRSQAERRRIVMQENSSKKKIKKIRFSLEADEAKKVSLVGEFNNWNPDADPMQRDENGTWTKTKMLSPGNLEYKFFVDGEWIQDPENLRTCPNCFGTQNSVVKVIELARAGLYRKGTEP